MAARRNASMTDALAGMRNVLGAAVGAAAETYIAAAGSVLEADRLPADGHRPWPIPSGPWAMAQRWEDALFLHWSVPPAKIAGLLPAGLTLDTIDRSAWVGITAFQVRGTRLRGSPALAPISDFPEVNVRTYVTAGDKPGVFFFSLDAPSMLSFLGGTTWYALPYFVADCRMETHGRFIHFASQRQSPGAPSAELAVKYRARGAVTSRARLVAWLTERYCLYSCDGQRLARAEIHHAPWPMQEAEAVITRNTLGRAAGLAVGGAPRLVHYASGVDAVAWAPTPVRRSRHTSTR